MARDHRRGSLLRTREGGGHGRVTFVELFFDLVFVFAVTQLSHSLLAHFTLAGAAQTALLMLAVWWVWIYTSSVTNWLDPETIPVRLMLFVLMLAGLVLSTAIPKAFETRGAAFAAAYVFMQVGRSLFMLRALKPHSPGNYRNFQRITAWLVLAGLFWTAGAFAEGSARFGLWAVALALEYVSPSLGFWTPGLSRSTTADWDVEGGHIAERCGLFIIIALGESLLVTGATFGNLAWAPATVAAFLTAVVGSIAMWWIYFAIGAERASRLIAGSPDPGRLARLAYTYIHLPIVAGIIVAAVGDEFTLAHPDQPTDTKTILAVLGGPALFLVGNLLFKRVTAGWFPLSHLVGLALLAGLVPLSFFMSAAAAGATATIVLVVVAVWEWRSRAPRRGATSHDAPDASA
ncbi:low temperature requirement protein A [Chelatococcus sp. SYSU_G07232]|uniref:Low temperature requirement protein A n=1 Tax=Chelatococcus albus TaxID=3047466 RepID=A0ABT7ACB2_9HYPH|nr:low temperature requirement protein A [Chelatococcus sp. SYSU_G07232]MDJ1157006.1 low temperature requirement protein A [Chelatococcus sp. SYSU_G07232]